MFSWESIAAYCLFSLLAFYQQLWARDFRGKWQWFGLVLALMGFAAMLTGFAYLGYYGWTRSIIGAICALVLSIVVSGVVGPLLERAVGRLAISVASFFWPLPAVMMFVWL